MVVPEISLDNPLRWGLERQRIPPPCVLVIFGATGDLAQRKLLPAIYRLAAGRQLPAGFTVVAAGRRPMSDDAYRQQALDALIEHGVLHSAEDPVWATLAQGLRYTVADPSTPGGFEGLAALLGEIDTTRGTRGNHLFYLATPPAAFGPTVEELGRVGLNAAPPGAWSRVIIEKPFGHDLASARALNQEIHAVFDERQVYRIDHYLGKETVQNILVFRFANGIFEPLWNRRYIDHVQITVAESVGVEGRGGYYDQSGVIRDMIQNHMLQLLTMVAMEPPVAFEADVIRDEKVKVLRAMRPILPGETGERTVRAQYGPGIIGGRSVPGYRSEEGVPSTSLTDTYTAMTIFIDDWRWAGVPFYLRSGKRLAKRMTEVAIVYNRPPLRLFHRYGSDNVESNVLTLRIQPDDGIAMKFTAKLPGAAMDLRSVQMDFDYGDTFATPAPEAYERLLLDSMLGDSTLFIRRDEVEAAWSFIDPIIAGWQAEGAVRLPEYAAGSWGPREADALLERDGRRWRRL